MVSFRRERHQSFNRDIELEEGIAYLRLLAIKGKRSRRRILEATKESGKLQVHFNAQREVDGRLVLIYPTVESFKQLMRSYRHSCHAGCCRWSKYVKRADNRQSRHQAKMALAKRCGDYDILRRKHNWASEADYKGT